MALGNLGVMVLLLLFGVWVIWFGFGFGFGVMFRLCFVRFALNLFVDWLRWFELVGMDLTGWYW